MMSPEEALPSITLTNSPKPSQPTDENDNDNKNTPPTPFPDEPLEVFFPADRPSRRKSSFPDGNKPSSSSSNNQRPTSSRRRTSFFVHGFLDDHRLQDTHTHPSDHDTSNDTKREDMIPDKTTSTHTNQEHHTQSHSGLASVLEDSIDNTSVQSRLLTKKELSDMAFGLRELTKRLSHFRLKLKVHNIFLLTKAHDETLIGYTRDVAEWLLSTSQSGGAHTVYVEDTLQHHKGFRASELAKGADEGSQLKFWNNKMCTLDPNAYDVVIALGGDGTVLYASWLFQRIVPPVLSFALGSLGFLTKFDFGGYKETLHQAFAEGVTLSVRLRLEATVMRAVDRDGEGKREHRDLIDELVGEEEGEHTHRPEQSYNILNDVVMDRGPSATMSSIEVFGDNFHITTVQADGVCVATPTGSTAYNLAAGGSLCHPDNPVILVTAIAPHTLSFRPILLPDTLVLRIGVPFDARTNPWVSFDGKDRIELLPGDYVTVSASRYPFPAILPLGAGSEDWIDSISRTLNWNSRQRQKAFSKD